MPPCHSGDVTTLTMLNVLLRIDDFSSGSSRSTGGPPTGGTSEMPFETSGATSSPLPEEQLGYHWTTRDLVNQHRCSRMAGKTSCTANQNPSAPPRSRGPEGPSHDVYPPAAGRPRSRWTRGAHPPGRSIPCARRRIRRSSPAGTPRQGYGGPLQRPPR